jgi:dihydrofolate synthase/folylpolyglutamate synthase
VGVPLLLAGRDLHVGVRERTRAGQRLDCAGPGWRLDDVRLALLGAYQPGNALLAVAAASALGVDEPAIRGGLARVRWPGRFQVIPGRPTLVLDGAHNPAGAAALAASLRELFADTPLTLVVAIMRDKDAAGILAPLAPLARRIVLTTASTPRALPPEALRAALPAGLDARVDTAATVDEALALARDAHATPTICVAGSLYLVGDTLARLLGPDKPCPIENGAASMESLFS